jgi:hypothetical protein
MDSICCQAAHASAAVLVVRTVAPQCFLYAIAAVADDEAR